jgi:RNA polymerase sigma-70 factor, ECF subfamily
VLDGSAACRAHGKDASVLDLMMAGDLKPAPAAEPGADGEAASALPEFERLHALYFGFTWRVLGHLGVPDHALDDVAQEVWIIVHQRLQSFEGRSELRTWLFGIAFNVARSHRRADVRRAKHAGSLPLASPPLDPEAIHAGQEAWSLVQRFLATLDEQRRAIFVSNLLEHLPAVDTAEAVGVDVTTVYKRVRALRHAFRGWLAKEHAEKRRSEEQSR